MASCEGKWALPRFSLTPECSWLATGGPGRSCTPLHHGSRSPPACRQQASRSGSHRMASGTRTTTLMRQVVTEGLGLRAVSGQASEALSDRNSHVGPEENPEALTSLVRLVDGGLPLRTRGRDRGRAKSRLRSEPQKSKKPVRKRALSRVGVDGFEPPTSRGILKSGGLLGDAFSLLNRHGHPGYGATRGRTHRASLPPRA